VHVFVFVEKTHERFLVAFGVAVDQIHMGLKFVGFDLQS
jgi:hypothetical protein